MRTIEKTDEYLKAHGIMPSYQRIRVFDYLHNNRNHPTVDSIYKELVGDIPSLSKTTVYNTLRLFNEKGIILIINIEDNESRFDADISNHGHFKCKECGEIFDFDLGKDDLHILKLEEFSIDEQHVYLKGRCPKCK
ncbi:MAG: transcriptional repressor [Bacteroidetes bacterium]|jgi:Fur family peroxide stress response transcriptional regulator|nr:transcriptional repressor [Bacteroidota bacterium]MBT4400147.1 transcriptional repressor [Bacteroidota bacterium]MBT4412072.1 transcriptional repressor [Bacteroidota bacterium]MBT5425555.1 transcriptional repressor [Bacteroidota bacterium]MBT7091772.1 transcriptional repressor [Bacteroidota bacterium]